MSVRFLTWSFHLQLPDIPGKMAAKGVLNALADHADEQGRSWPSVARLALFTGCDERTARKALAKLVELGLVVRESRPGRSDVFILQMAADPSQKQPLSKATPPKNNPSQNWESTPPNSALDPPQSWEGNHHEPPNNRQNARARVAARTDHPPVQLQLPDTAKWAERLANHRPLQGKPRWSAAWGLSPDSAGLNPLIPDRLLREWRARYDHELAAMMAQRKHAAQQDGAIAAEDPTTVGISSRRLHDPRQSA